MAMKKVVKPTSKKKNNDKNLEQTFKAGEAARKSKGLSPSAGTRTQTAQRRLVDAAFSDKTVNKIYDKLNPAQKEAMYTLMTKQYTPQSKMIGK